MLVHTRELDSENLCHLLNGRHFDFRYPDNFSYPDNYSVPHEESKRMLGMCDVTSIAVIIIIIMKHTT